MEARRAVRRLIEHSKSTTRANGTNRRGNKKLLCGYILVRIANRLIEDKRERKEEKVI